MTVTYRTGYGTTRRTRAELLAWSRFAPVHPEVQRRVLAMLDAARAAGTDLGIGGAYRSPEEQAALFEQRHDVTAGDGCCVWAGKRWQLVTGAHVAPPGRSYHEPCAPDTSGNLRVLALDMVGWETGWLERNAGRFLMRTFSGALAEPWHIQPVEIPTARVNYSPTANRLMTFSDSTPAPYGLWPSRTDKPWLRTGMTHEAVYYAERVLAERAGQQVAVDRTFTAGTATAVKNLQAFFGLVVDGVVGPQTWAVIDYLAGKR